jgi:hypothetical protein
MLWAEPVNADAIAIHLRLACKADMDVVKLGWC